MIKRKIAVLIIGAAFVTTLIATSCGSNVSANTEERFTKVFIDNYYVITDIETGCQYIDDTYVFTYLENTCNEKGE